MIRSEGMTATALCGNPELHISRRVQLLSFDSPLVSMLTDTFFLCVTVMSHLPVLLITGLSNGDMLIIPALKSFPVKANIQSSLLQEVSGFHGFPEREM